MNMSSKPLKRSLLGIRSHEKLKIQKLEMMKENIPPKFVLSTENSFQQNLPKNVDGQKYTPTKKIYSKAEDPVTPNTNIKLLTMLAAERDYANCCTPKSHSSIKNDFHEKSHDLEGNSMRANRKDKSLALICTRFLAMYPEYPACGSEIVIWLDEACFKLGIERRRLYDIVNVFESIEMLKKLAKNRYMWYGKNNLLTALYKIKTAAMKENIAEKLQYVLNMESSLVESKQSCILDEVEDFKCQSSSTVPEYFRSTSPFPELRREKSLAIMSQKFLMLFLVSPAKVISLGVAAKVLNGFQSYDKGTQMKTQIRRLYDIANVLSSIGLIQKDVAVVQNWKRPTFKYTGPDFFENNGAANVMKEKAMSNEKSRSLIRHSSFQEICAVAEMEHRRLFYHEDPTSAPPFEQSFLKRKEISNSTKCITKTNSDSNLESIYHNPNVNNVSKASHLNETTNQSLLKPVPLANLSNLKLINVPKEMMARSGPYLLLNPVNKDCSKSSVGTFLLINPLPHQQLAASATIKESKTSSSQTVKLSLEQRDMILKSLNLSLSDGQVASIQLDGSSNLQNSNKNYRGNVLRIIDKNGLSNLENYSTVVINEKTSNDNLCLDFGDVQHNTASISEFHCNSPAKLPSGLITPTSDTSSMSLETDYLLKRNETLNAATSNKNNIQSCDVEGCVSKKEIKESDSKILNTNANMAYNISDITRKNLLENVQNFNICSNSCSNDSLNSEISHILLSKKEHKTKTTKFEPFLIDEKTILSPIKSKITNSDSIIPFSQKNTFLLNEFVHTSHIEANNILLH